VFTVDFICGSGHEGEIILFLSCLPFCPCKSLIFPVPLPSQFGGEHRNAILIHFEAKRTRDVVLWLGSWSLVVLKDKTGGLGLEC